MVERKKYLKQLWSWKDEQVIKVVTGIRRCGKSTLLKMITGVVIPTSGTIEIQGKVSSLLELGIGFNPDLTGVENIYQHGQVMRNDK